MLAGAQTAFANSDPDRSKSGNFAPDWSQIDAATWSRTQLLYVCSPGNPTGAVMPLDEWRMLFDLSDRHGFVIASDECYSEIYFRDEPPLGSLQAAKSLGRDDFRNLVAFTSLSKRSNVPGLRSWFCGDVDQGIPPYRTYHGGAMSPAVMSASVAGRRRPRDRQPSRQYRGKVRRLSRQARRRRGPAHAALPPLGPGVRAVRRLRARPERRRSLHASCVEYNVTVLPAAILARQAQGANLGRVGCAWPWLLSPPNALKLRTASFSSVKPPSLPIWLASPHRLGISLRNMTKDGKPDIETAWTTAPNSPPPPRPRRCWMLLSTSSASRTAGSAARYLGRGRGRVVGEPVAQEGRVALLPLEREPHHGRRASRPLLRQGAHQVRHLDEGVIRAPASASSPAPSCAAAPTSRRTRC